jgi:hypothetical protein
MAVPVKIAAEFEAPVPQPLFAPRMRKTLIARTPSFRMASGSSSTPSPATKSRARSA